MGRVGRIYVILYKKRGTFSAPRVFEVTIGTEYANRLLSIIPIYSVYPIGFIVCQR